MTEKTTPKLSGPREGVWLMRLIAELVEKNPEIKPPTISINGYGGDTVTFHPFTTAAYDYSLSAKERTAAKLLGIERQFNTITEFFGPDVVWTANHPSDTESSLNKTYFILSAVHTSGVGLSVMASRSDVGENVHAIDSGPDITETGDGYLQAVRTNVTVWKPNINLTALARPGFALPGSEPRMALTS